jgi:tetratricopeptide (TPR) repeat protein
MPEEIGRYQVVRVLGRGGMGAVFAAVDPLLRRAVAVKLLASSVGDSSPRLLEEAQAMATVVHPNIVPILDVGATDDGTPFLAMEIVPGGTLRNRLAGRTHTWQEIASYFLAAGEGLAAIHEAGLVHRDFKPHNVLLDLDGRALVTDFGLARSTATPLDELESDDALDLNASLADRRGLVGTPRYMSPEAFGSRQLDARSDQFSFCVSLYEALTGEHPFAEAGDAAPVIAGNVLRGDLYRRRFTNTPRRVVRAVLRGLSRDPSDRFPSMRELLAELRPVPRWQHRSSRVRLVIAATAAALAVAGGVLWTTLDDHRSAAPSEITVESSPTRIATSEQLLAAALEADTTPDARRELLEQAESVAMAEGAWLVASEAAQSRMTLVANEQRQYGEALEIGRLAEQYLRRAGNPTKARALLLSKLSGVAWRAGKLEESIKAAQEASTLLPTGDDQQTAALVKLGTALAQGQQNREAERVLKRALDQALVGGDDALLQRASIHHNLVEPLAALGKDSEARLHGRTAVALLRQLGEPARPMLAAALTRVGAVEGRTGHPAEALAAFRAAMDTHGRDKGPMFTASLMFNIGAASLDLGQLRQSETYLERARVLAEETMGPGNVVVSLARLKLAECASLGGNHERARKLFAEGRAGCAEYELQCPPASAVELRYLPRKG